LVAPPALTFVLVLLGDDALGAVPLDAVGLGVAPSGDAVVVCVFVSAAVPACGLSDCCAAGVADLPSALPCAAGAFTFWLAFVFWFVLAFVLTLVFVFVGVNVLLITG
jgi:hypothetical protein